LQETVSTLFAQLDLPQEFVSRALNAFDKHSQNNVFYDPKKVRNQPEKVLEETDKIFNWVGIPVNSKTPIDEFKRAIAL